MKGLGLLDLAQMYWFQRFLEADGRRKAVEKCTGEIIRPFEGLDWELYCWAVPYSKWDGYPRLATVTWPG